MYQFRLACVAALAALVLAACGSNSPTSTVSASTARGTLAADPPLRIASLSAAAFQAELSASSSGSQLLTLAGAPACGVDFYYLEYWTVGGAGEVIEDSGALMVPTGAAPGCSGPRPILLYAHATQTDKLANIADITNPSNTEGDYIAAMFASQGYIVVAPNYAGYDISTLGYHPFLDAAQQSGEMLDILTAARTALPKTFSASTSDSGQLLLTGYSEGGHVTLATLKALEAKGQTVTAVAGGSGPYALEAFGDAIMFGAVDLDSTVFAPLLTTSYQHEFGNIYSTTSDIYSSTYATGIDTLLPSATPVTTLISQGLLPETALFDSTTPVVTVPGSPAESTALTEALSVPTTATVPPSEAADVPLFDLGFGSPYLINNSVRVAYALDAATDPDGEDTFITMAAASPALAPAAPTYPLRSAFYQNDMRTWFGSLLPSAPLLLCGGENDPTVYFFNTETMAAYWSALPAGALTVLDVDPASGPSGTFAALQAEFQGLEMQSIAALEATGLTATQAEEELAPDYHTDVEPFCLLGARAFFNQILAE